MTKDEARDKLRAMLPKGSTVYTVLRHVSRSGMQRAISPVLCRDEDAIDGFRFAFVREKQRELGALMQAAFRSWLKATVADCKDQYSDETFSETADANGHEYDAAGEMV